MLETDDERMADLVGLSRDYRLIDLRAREYARYLKNPNYNIDKMAKKEFSELLEKIRIPKPISYMATKILSEDSLVRILKYKKH